MHFNEINQIRLINYILQQNYAKKIVLQKKFFSEQKKLSLQIEFLSVIKLQTRISRCFSLHFIEMHLNH